MIIKLNDLSNEVIKNHLPSHLGQRYSVEVIDKAINELKAVNMRFSVKTGKVTDTILRSAINNYKSNPYNANDLDSIIGNEFAPFIGDRCASIMRGL